VANYVNQNDFLYHGGPDGTFTRITNVAVASDGASTWSGAWADCDRDGFLDLYVSSFANDLLYRNNGDGTFVRITNTVLSASGGISRACAWADYDNDGDPDLFVVNASQMNFLFRNNGDGTFLRITNGNIVTDVSGANGCAWGDYDNDGDLDLFVARNGNDWLYQNNGDGSFTKITNSIVATSGSNSWACAWVDYDNDGWLDLYVANNGSDFLYRNNGDGTLARITTGSPANDGADSRGCAWGDYDDDGFPDLFVPNFSQNNFLYRNNGNANHWLKVKCVGTTSNRSALGAKVRVQATISGMPRWQLREITSGDGLGGHGLVPIFGLGDAARATTVRVEWPSGRIDEVHDIPANQLLVLTELLARPWLSAPQMVAGQFHFQLTGNAGQVYTIETSTNLQDWTPWQTVTNDRSTVPLCFPAATNCPQLYYRAVGQ